MDADRVYVAAVDHGRLPTQQGWIDAKSVGWDRGSVDMYRPVTALNTYSAGERLARAQQILDLTDRSPRCPRCHQKRATHRLSPVQ
ncbi:MAG: hypothetical protein ACYC0X_34560 [Pirellulaceae bacterium]